MQTVRFDYRDHDEVFEAFLATEAPTERRPPVLVAHAWAGQDDFARGKAEALAQLGFVGVAIDMYGRGKRGTTPQENAALMRPFVDDRRLLRRRIQSAVHAVTARSECDGGRVGAIGFCFGGMCVLDLARSAMPTVRAVVSFHGLLVPNDIDPPNRITAKVLIAHGFDDPMAPPAQLVELGRELTAAGADWQAHIHGHAMHAFTNPMANMPQNGLRYDATADHRSWTAMTTFLREAL